MISAQTVNPASVDASETMQKSTRRRFLQSLGASVPITSTNITGQQSPLNGAWPQPNYNAAGTNFNPNGFQHTKKPERKWKHNIGERPSQPVVASGTVFISDTTHLRAINAETGKLKWEQPHQSTEPIYFSETHYYEGTVFVSYNGGIIAYEAATGNVQWSVVPPDSPNVVTVASTGLYVGGSEQVYCLDQHSGELRWQTSEEYFELHDDDSQISGLVVGQGMVLVSTSEPQVYGLDASTGDVYWGKYTDVNSITNLVAYQDSLIYCFTNTNSELFYSINQYTGEEERYDVLKKQLTSNFAGIGVKPHPENPEIYAVDESGTIIHSVHATYQDPSGKELFHSRSIGDLGTQSNEDRSEIRIRDPPVLTPNMMYISSEVAIYAVKIPEGEIAWQIESPQNPNTLFPEPSRPTVISNRIFLVNQKSQQVESFGKRDGWW